MTEKSHIWKPLRENTPNVQWTRVENTAVPGAPDIHGFRHGRDIWIETKIFHGNKISFRPTQIAWIMKRQAHGGNTWILARRNDSMLLYKSTALQTLLDAGVVAIDGVKSGRANPDLVFTESLAFPKPFNWQRLETVLFL